MAKYPFKVVDEVVLFQIKIVLLVVGHVLEPIIEVFLGFGLLLLSLKGPKRVKK